MINNFHVLNFLRVLFFLFCTTLLFNGNTGNTSEKQNLTHELILHSLLQAGVSTTLGIDSQYTQEKILTSLTIDPIRTRVALDKAIHCLKNDFYNQAGTNEHYLRFKNNPKKMEALSESLGLAYEMKTLSNGLTLSFRGKELKGLHARTVLLLLSAYEQNIDLEAQKQNISPLHFRLKLEKYLDKKLREIN